MRSCYGYSDTERTPNFYSVTDAAQWVAERTGKNPHTVSSNITKVLFGERITAYGFRWFDGESENE